MTELCGYSPATLRQIIQCALRLIGMYTPPAENLLLGTSAAESHCGLYTRQIAGGPARGIYQMEPATLDDIYINYLSYRPQLRTMVEEATGIIGPHIDRLEHDPIYASVLARIYYMRVRQPLPPDLPGQASYWKQHWNTPEGAGTVEKYIRAWRAFVGLHGNGIDDDE